MPGKVSSRVILEIKGSLSMCRVYGGLARAFPWLKIYSRWCVPWKTHTGRSYIIMELCIDDCCHEDIDLFCNRSSRILLLCKDWQCQFLGQRLLSCLYNQWCQLERNHHFRTPSLAGGSRPPSSSDGRTRDLSHENTRIPCLVHSHRIQLPVRLQGPSRCTPWPSPEWNTLVTDHD